MLCLVLLVLLLTTATLHFLLYHHQHQQQQCLQQQQCSVALLQAGLRALERLKGAELLTPVYMMLIPAGFYAVLHCTGTTSDQVTACIRQVTVLGCSCNKVHSILSPSRKHFVASRISVPVHFCTVHCVN
jgi:hypothetical protein